MTEDAAAILSLTRDLCAFRSGVVAEENEALFERIGREAPIRLHRYRSGETHNGWTVPDRWRVVAATIRRDGRTVFDGAAHLFGVAAYSNSFHGDLSWEDLAPHLVTDPRLPEAHVFHCLWQYRPWAADWALCVPHEIHRTLGPGRYRVDLAVERSPGEMLVADAECRGRTDRTIVLAAHTCHPHQANDGFAGVAVLLRLFRWLRGRRNRYTYRLVFGPEHLGTVFYLRDRPRREIGRLTAGIFAEMPGTPFPIKAASTFLGDRRIDLAFRNALRHGARAWEAVPWRMGAGNDETVWEAPGYEVPFVEVTRCRDLLDPFPGYHTSLDTPERVDPEQVDEFYRVLQGVVEILENDATLRRTFDGLVCLSNPRYGLYLERPDPAIAKDLAADSEAWGRMADHLPRYLDGSSTVLEVAERHGLPFDRLRAYLGRFEEKGLARARFAPMERPPVSRPAGRRRR